MSGQVRSGQVRTGPEQAALCHFDGERALLSQRAKSEHWGSHARQLCCHMYRIIH